MRKISVLLFVVCVGLLTVPGANLVRGAALPNAASATNYHIEYFTTDQTSIPAGGCVVLSYWVVGARKITLHGSNWSGGPEIITDNSNQRTVCPSAAGNYVPGQPVVYKLHVIFLNGRTENRRVIVNVALPPSPTPIGQ